VGMAFHDEPLLVEYCQVPFVSSTLVIGDGQRIAVGIGDAELTDQTGDRIARLLVCFWSIWVNANGGELATVGALLAT